MDASMKWTTVVLLLLGALCQSGCEGEGQSADSSPWSLCTDKPPSNPKFYPTIGNGHVATVVHSDSVFMNGFYNGNGTDSARARIPGILSLSVTNISQPTLNSSYCLHLEKGLYVEKFVGDHWHVELRMFAHRTLTRLLVTEVLLQTDGNQPLLKIDFARNYGSESTDVGFAHSMSDVVTAGYMFGSNKVPETPSTENVQAHIYYTAPPTEIVVQPNEVRTKNYLYMAAISHLQNEAKEAYVKGEQMFRDGTLESSHTGAWSDVWRSGRIDIEGNNHLASIVYSSLYYILSSTPTINEVTWPFVGLSPGDLAHGNDHEDYMGHVFWDQDTWMFPPILALHTDVGRTLVNTRIRTLDGSMEYARQRGYEGAMYSWESAFTGLDVCPAWQYSEYEMHVTGDVAFAFKQYLMMTRDTELLRHGRLNETVYKIADFWMSRVTLNSSTGMYDIIDVMPPDEHHWPVNNSVYTNSVARISLRLPAYVSSLLGETPPTKYEEVASKLVVLLDTEKQYHPEYAGYTTDVPVKQADAILLGFPLDVPMTLEQRRNDLEIYQKVTPGGPAMSWGMFSIGWVELGNMQEAKTAFYKQLLNNQLPFNVWTEVADGTGATNFITGQGGFLQSILFGYGGLRIHSNRITLECKPLPDATGFTVVGLDYLNNSLDISCIDTSMTITLTKTGVPLYVGAFGNSRKLRLITDKTEQFRNVTIEITSEVPLEMMSSTKSPSNNASQILFLSSTLCVLVILLYVTLS